MNFGSSATGGSVLNTGSITSGGTLTVNTGTLTNRANVVDVGELWSYIKDTGYLKTTGTMVQPGGFMSAAAGGLTLNVDQFNQIGGMLSLLDPNGQIDHAATEAFIAGVSAQLGDKFVQQALQDDLHTEFVKQGGNFGIQQVGMIVAAVAFSMVLGPMFSAMVGQLAGVEAGMGTLMAAAGTTAEGVVIGAGVGNIALSAGLTAMTSSAFSQLAMNGSINFGSVLTTGLSSAVTAGLLNGITYSSDYGFGVTELGGAQNSLSSLAGVNPSYVAGTASNAAASTADKLLSQVLAILGQSAIQAGVQSTIQGGSFLEALKTSGINSLGAALVFQIGEVKVGDAFGDGTGRTLLSIAAHAALGCAGSAAAGNGCAGGAIGAAASAAFTPDFIKAIDPTGAPLDVGQLAALSTLSSLLGAAAAGLAGASPSAGAFWAQNQALNNDAKDDHVKDAAEKGGLASNIADFLLERYHHTFDDIPGSFANWGRQLLGHMQRDYGGQGVPVDANKQIDPTDGPDNKPGAPAVTTPAILSVCVLLRSAACFQAVLAAGGTAPPPSNWTFSSGNNDSQSNSGESRATNTSGGAADDGVRLNNQLAASEIANGHAFGKHVVEQNEFGATIKTQQQFAEKIESILNSPSATKQLSRGRSAYWDDSSGTVVIRDPKSSDGGTAFRPTNGKAYFNNLR